MRPSINVEHLTWDTEFFGFPVGCVMLTNADVDPNELRRVIDMAGETLTYVFLPVGDGSDCAAERPRSALVDMGGMCRDLKVTFRKAIDTDVKEPEGLESVAASCITPELESLAYASGWCSRFVADDRLRRFFKPMYLAWLRRDLTSGKVFVRPSADRPEGMATVSIDSRGMGKIGLVAVDAKSCGKGIGTSLLKDVDRYLLSHSVSQCEVVTQGMNVAAHRLYEKVGFKPISRREVWHVWRPKVGHV